MQNIFQIRPDFLSLIAVVCMVTAIQGTLSAQVNDSLHLSKDEAVELALEQNRQITISEYDIDIANRDVNEIRGNLLPNISLSGNYNRNLQQPVIFLPEGSPFGDVLEMGSDNAFSGEISANMPIFQPGLYANIRASRIGIDVAKENDRETRMEIAAEVKQSYTRALMAARSLEVTEASFEFARDNFQQTDDLFQQGQVSEFEKLRSEVEMENLRPGVENARDNYRVAVNALKNTIGLDPQTPVSLEDELSPVDFEHDYEGEELLTNNNPALQRLDYQEDMARERLSSERASYLPSLSAFGNYNAQTESNDFEVSDYNWINTSAVGMRISIPVFEGFSRNQRVKKAELEALQVREQKKMTKEAMELQLENQLFRIQQARSRYEMQENSVDLARRSVEMARVRHRTGVATILELNDAEMAYMEARLNYYEAIADYNIAVAEYKKLTGTILN